MSYILSPTYIDIDLTVPMAFKYLGPKVDYMSSDPRLRERMVKYYYSKIIDKWLYNEKSYEDLTNYFNLQKEGDQLLVSIVRSLEDAHANNGDQKYIFRFIEAVFVNEKFVSKVLNEYTERANVPWYDLPQNNAILKSLFRHKLKKAIVKAVKKLSKETKKE
jgi:hypothetical protein